MEKRPAHPKAGAAGAKAPAQRPKPAADQEEALVPPDPLPVANEDPAPPDAEGSPRNGENAADLDVSEEAAPARPAARKSAASRKDSARSNQLDDFRLLKKLGQGGMGSVYKAHQISLDREVAVKILSKELAARPAFVQRFLREARLMAKLDHPNILRCYAVQEAHGYHYLAMEYVGGGTVQGWLDKLGRFSLADALHLTLTCARALGHAHAQGLVHRDVKPDNILLTSKGVIKVADLGLAKAIDDDNSLTRTGTGAGTPIYMAPEQARDVKHVDGRSDIYALGCMLYYFLTGEAPFKGATLVELIEAKEKGKFTPARQLNDEVPERLDLILDKMLARKPELRFQTCEELVEQLEALTEAGDGLSFLQPAGTSKPAMKKPAPAPAPRMPPPGARNEEPETPGEFWYASLTNAQGKQVTRKMTEPEVMGAIKSGSFTADTQISRTLRGGYRALATYPEFEPTLRARMTREHAERKGQKYRSMYEQIEKEEQARQRWRWLHNLFLKTGGFVGFLVWLAILAGACVGAYFLIRWGISALGDKVSKL